MYVLAKFQLHILKTLKLQPYKVEETERLICMVSIGNYRSLVLKRV